MNSNSLGTGLKKYQAESAIVAYSVFDTNGRVPLSVEEVLGLQQREYASTRTLAGPWCSRDWTTSTVLVFDGNGHMKIASSTQVITEGTLENRLKGALAILKPGTYATISSQELSMAEVAGNSLRAKGDQRIEDPILMLLQPDIETRRRYMQMMARRVVEEGVWFDLRTSEGIESVIPLKVKNTGRDGICLSYSPMGSEARFVTKEEKREEVQYKVIRRSEAPDDFMYVHAALLGKGFSFPTVEEAIRIRNDSARTEKDPNPWRIPIRTRDGVAYNPKKKTIKLVLDAAQLSYPINFRYREWKDSRIAGGPIATSAGEMVLLTEREYEELPGEEWTQAGFKSISPGVLDQTKERLLANAIWSRVVPDKRELSRYIDNLWRGWERSRHTMGVHSELYGGGSYLQGVGTMCTLRALYLDPVGAGSSLNGVSSMLRRDEVSLRVPYQRVGNVATLGPKENNPTLEPKESNGTFHH